ncbi:MAG: hypothetical protein HY012_06420 [Acidobacteria bacterium]|nr:hypothetical protein [Acidobacteriota bacterium]
MDAMIVFAVWLVLAVLVGAWAKQKGLRPMLYFFWSLLLSPAIGFLLVAIARPNWEKAGELAGKKKCPRCAEWVQREAQVCHFCQFSFEPPPPTLTPNAHPHMSSTPSPVPPAPPQAPQAKLSAMQRIIGVFTSPGETFADIARAPSWVIPVVLLTVLSLVVCAVMMKRVDWNDFLEKQMSKSARFEQLSSEQKAQQLSIASKIIPYQVYGIGLLGSIAGAAIIGGVYLGAFNLFLSAGIKFKTAFGITAHAMLVGLVSSPLLIIVMFLKPFGDVDPEHLLASNVGEFLSSETPKWLLKLTGSLDIFSIWMLALLAIGFAAANPRKISKGGAFGVVFGVWAVFVLVKVMWAVIFS